MNRRYLSALTSVLYFVCFTAVIGMLGHALNIFSFMYGEKIILGAIIVISGYLATAFHCLGIEKRNRRKWIMRLLLCFIFAFYAIMLVDFTLIDGSLGRNILNYRNWNETAFKQYLDESTNLIPFATVRLFVNGYKNGNLTFIEMLENVLGNIVAFMPLPFFLAALFKPFNRWYRVMTAVLLSVLAVELLQFLFLTGSSDIDDVILNVSGAMLFYFILRRKIVSRRITKITFGVWETVENKV